MRPLLVLIFVLAFAAAASGCGHDSAPQDGANPDPRCQPIAATGCALPYPSSFYEQADPATETKLRVAFPAGVLPKNQVGKDFDVTRLDRLDGFSTASQIVADVGARVDPAQLPSQSAYDASATAASAVQILEYPTGTRVPLFAEVDRNIADACKIDMDCGGGACVAGACTPKPAQALLIHPAMTLKPATRYVVALVGLHDPLGTKIAIQPFQTLVAGQVDAASPLKAVEARYDEIFALLDKSGVPRSSLTLAWDFTTGSEKQAVGHMVTIRDAAFKRWAADGLRWTVSEVNEPALADDAHLFREIKGTFAVPSFLTSNTDLGAGLKLDASGNPVDTGTNYEARLVIHVPRCAKTATKPLPIMVYGHGFFGSVDEINADYQKQLIDSLCMVQIATDWVGLDSADSVVVPIKVFGSFDNFWLPTDRLQQGVLNFLVLARLASRHFAEMKELALDGHPVVDGSEVYYLGISQGAIFGGTLLSLSPDIRRGALDVGAGAYSLMLTRSADFTTFKHILDYTYPVQIDQQLLLSLSQNYFDFTDPIRFLPHAFKDTFNDPATGTPMAPKIVALQESIGDAQVPNVATRYLARSAGLPILGPAAEAVPGLVEETGPLDAAYSQWNVHPMPLPADADTPPRDNPAHEAIRRLPALQEQLRKLFVPDGRVTQTCSGACSF